MESGVWGRILKRLSLLLPPVLAFPGVGRWPDPGASPGPPRVRLGVDGPYNPKILLSPRDLKPGDEIAVTGLDGLTLILGEPQG